MKKVPQIILRLSTSWKLAVFRPG